MKTWKQNAFIGLVVILALTVAITACDNDNDKPHTHEWEWKVTTPATTEADGLETETCSCGETNGTKPIPMLPKNQTAEIEDLFVEGLGYSTTIEAFLTNTEWIDVANKIETAIEDAYKAAPNALSRGRFTVVFGRDNTKIIVEKVPVGYAKWKTTDDGVTMYLAYDELDNDLTGSVTNAVIAMRDNVPTIDGE